MENKINIVITENLAEMSREDLKVLNEQNFLPTYSSKDGVELLKKIETLEPDVVLMDMFMTRMDGVGVLRALSRKELIKKPLVLGIRWLVLIFLIILFF